MGAEPGLAGPDRVSRLARVANSSSAEISNVSPLARVSARLSGLPVVTRLRDCLQPRGEARPAAAGGNPRSAARRRKRDSGLPIALGASDEVLAVGFAHRESGAGMVDHRVCSIRLESAVSAALRSRYRLGDWRDMRGSHGWRTRSGTAWFAWGTEGAHNRTGPDDTRAALPDREEGRVDGWRPATRC